MISDLQVHHRIPSDAPDAQKLVLACAFTLNGRRLEFDAQAPRIVDGKTRGMDDALDEALKTLIGKILDAVVNLA